MVPILIVIGLVFVYLASCINILKEYERGVIFRLGRIPGGIDGTPKGPGLIFVLRPIDKIIKVETRTITMDVPPQDIITRDNVSVKVNAVLYFHVVQPILAVVRVQNFLFATSQLAQTTLRSVLGAVELDELLVDREKINTELQTILDKQTDPWGVKVTAVEVKHVDLPLEMQRAMAAQAEAERSRRAKVIAAEGELQASQKLSEAATVISSAPGALQLRYLQTLHSIAAEHNSTILFPLPIEIMRGIEGFMKKSSG